MRSLLPMLLACAAPDPVEAVTPPTHLDGDDVDGDSYLSGEDCDDNNPLSNPGAVEICDEEDNDCDGAVDEGVGDTYYADFDQDGHGDPNMTLEACLQPDLYENSATDCDDTDEDVHPGSPEVCNTIDDDCNGTIDDRAGCPCDQAWLDGRAYMFCDVPSGWMTANQLCQNNGYVLLNIDTEGELEWLLAELSAYEDADWWVGYSDLAAEGNWAWEGGQDARQIDWCDTQPDNDHNGSCVADAEEDCAVLDADGCLRDEACDCARTGYICEIPTPTR